MLQLGHLERAGAELELGLCGTPRAHAGHGGRDDGGMRPRPRHTHSGAPDRGAGIAIPAAQCVRAGLGATW